VKRVIARPWAPQERRRQLSLKSRVMGGLLPAPPFMTSQQCVCVVCLLKALAHVYIDSCAHTSDPVSLHCNHGLYNLAVWPRLFIFVTLPEASMALDGMGFQTQGDGAVVGMSYLLSAICLSRIGSHENLKPLHCRGRRCGYFRKAQPAVCLT